MPDTTLKNLSNITASTTIADSDISYVVRPSTNADYKATLGDLKTYMAPSKPQIVATHNSIATGGDAGNSSSRTDVQKQVRQNHWVGCQDVDQLQMGIGGYWMPASSNTGEVMLGNSFTWEAAFEYNSLTKSGFCAGKQIKDIDNKCGLVLTDPVGFTIPAGAQINSRQAMIVSDIAHNFLNYTANRIPGSASFRSPLTASQVSATGAMTTPSGGTNSFRGFQPFVILGIPKAPMVSVLVIGDSIADGVGDSTTFGTRGGIGYIRRGLEDVNGYSVPWHYQAVTGWALTGQALNLSPRTRDTWKYCTHALLGLGWNDISGVETLSNLQAKATATLNELKRTIGPYGKPLHVTVTTITPSASSSNSYINAAGQTLRTGYEIGGLRDQYNAWLKSLVGGALVDACLDIGASIEDPASPGRFMSNGTTNYATSDGIHPSAAAVNIMSPIINSWAVALKP